MGKKYQKTWDEGQEAKELKRGSLVPTQSRTAPVGIVTVICPL